MIMLTADSDKFDDFDVFDDFYVDHVTMMRINNTGVQLHYVEAGKEEAPLLLFVHGFPEFWFR